ncbi:hypothetical protein FACS189425_09310 [Clostridia bacterium]|nr:hypothetical protein FACS189425_09310 [Clostridia bacterium]
MQTGWIFDAETQLFSPPKVENPTLAVEILKDKLVSSDYKITKQAEAEFAGAELPYTEDEMKELHAERQDLRDQINMLESGSET